MQLSRIQDHRSPLYKLTRTELEYLARKEGRDDVIPGMPADLMRRKFELKPPSALPRPTRGRLGSTNALRHPPYEEWLKVAFAEVSASEVKQEVKEVSALDDLERQWKAQTASPFDSMSYAELRKECKRQGVKTKRTDKIADLRARLDGKNAS